MEDNERHLDPHGVRRGRRRGVALLAAATLVAATLTFNVAGASDSVDRAARNLGLPWFDALRDSDSDGLSDREELRGWKVSDGSVYTTDPKKQDTDGDGLVDPLEAGPRERAAGAASETYAGLSDPTETDTDGDGLDDGSEFFADLDPRLPDTDDDGLRDDVELAFGSDPSSANPDDDSYSDKAEYERGSDPLVYDLSLAQAAGAFVVGASAGDWAWAARKIGRLNEQQLQSPEYLIGQLISGLVGVGDVRDLAANLGTLDLVDAILSLVGIVPIVGDTARVIATLGKFAAHGDRAARAVAMTIERLPWSKADKASAREKIFGGTRRLPVELRGGPKEHSVYIGAGYVGRTKDFPARKAQHASAGRSFTPQLIPTATKLSLGEARAIEEACIVRIGLGASGGALENRIHSISPGVAHYAAAVEWGTRFLDSNRAACSVA
ncbi:MULTISPECIES: hypothetical protein [Aeromicrobium]|uniref:hypothetical protein n=1 Tax=Aeromicrobium TaxID=2040 RepID=UPI00257E887E|nr:MULTISPECIES: hypothetical protein [Aeromicrobium]